MKTRVPLNVLLALLLSLALLAGCSRSRNDGEIANEVRGKIAADVNVSVQDIEVRAENGVVTLSGTVESEMARMAAANSAAQVSGVRTVVNNLSVAEQARLQEPEAMPEPAPARKTQAPAQRTQRAAATTPPGRHPVQAAEKAEPAPPVAAAPPPAPAPRQVTIPAGTSVSVRLVDALDSEKNKAGDVFLATLNIPLHHDGEVVVPAFTEIEGRVIEAQDAGHFRGRSGLVLELTRLTVNGRSYQLQTDRYVREGASQGKRTAGAVGGGAAAGAILGGILGGGKGAAIGAAAGAGAGTGVQAATGGKPIRLPAETVLTFALETPLTVVPAAGSQRRQLPVE